MSSALANGKTPYAIVVGLDTLNGIQTVRILARHKIPIIAIAKDPKHHGCRTRLCERIIFTNTATEELIQTLVALGPELKQKAVLYPCVDMNMLLISRHRQALEPWYHVVLPAPEVIETLMNKLNFYTYAQQNGFPIPQTRYLNSQEDANRAAAELTFPCVLKPPMSAIPEWEKNSKLKAYKLSSPAELLEFYERSKVWAKDLIVQEWVEGPDSNLYSCNCYFNDQFEPVVTFVSRKLRQWPPVTGESCLGEECRDDVVLNGRSPIAEAGGVELLYTMYCDTVGLPLPENLDQSYKGVKWVDLRRDVQSALYHIQEGDLTLKGWWKSLQGKKAHALFAWNDPAPFFGDLVRAARLYMVPEERRHRDYRNL
ncbi:MAG: ATP-grasp enzyme-like protein [Chloroflexi bacterium]|nr:ATP-grasp enzyme-like protein [Chloroflexota bacterium]